MVKKQPSLILVTNFVDDTETLASCLVSFYHNMSETPSEVFCEIAYI